MTRMAIVNDSCINSVEIKETTLKDESAHTAPPEITAPPEVCLSTEQKEALGAVKDGKNVFITGSAGVGKSFLLNEILKALSRKSVYVTASTGVAACNIGGTTLHSFSGIGLGTKSAQELSKQILTKPYKAEVKQRWKRCQVLVIDEISMIDGELFSKIEEISRIVRKSEKPFGGIQMILCGDFLQLPPVNVKTFAFETAAWKSIIDKTIVLTKVFRQKLVGFVTLLNRLRVGSLKAIDIEVLNECRNTKFPVDGIVPTRLFPFRSSCDHLNSTELKKLTAPTMLFQSNDWSYNQTYQDQLTKNCKYPKELVLKVGAQVMLLTNLSVAAGMVNGSRGVVIGFKNRKQEIEEEVKRYTTENTLSETELKAYLDMINSMDTREAYDDDGYPLVKFTNGLEQCIKTDQITIEVNKKTMAYRTQLPLTLAWAVSVHKAQGMTLERIDINIARVFEHGQAYVALSRVTSLEGLLLRDFDASKITAHPKVLNYYHQLNSSFDQWSTKGEDELKDFIDRKRNPHKYKIEAKANIETPPALRKDIANEKLGEFMLETRFKQKRFDEKTSFSQSLSGGLFNNRDIPFIDLTSPTCSNIVTPPAHELTTTHIVTDNIPMHHYSSTPDVSGINPRHTCLHLIDINSPIMDSGKSTTPNNHEKLSMTDYPKKKITAPNSNTNTSSYEGNSYTSNALLKAEMQFQKCQSALVNLHSTKTHGSPTKAIATDIKTTATTDHNPSNAVCVIPESDPEDLCDSEEALTEVQQKANEGRSISCISINTPIRKRKRNSDSQNDFLRNPKKGYTPIMALNDSRNINNTSVSSTMVNKMTHHTHRPITNTDLSNDRIKHLLEQKREEIEKKKKQALLRLSSFKQVTVIKL